MAYPYKRLRTKDGLIDEHRLVMQNHLGRKLSSDEIVHHIDGNKSNNSISNLEITNKSDHARKHYERGDLRLSPPEKTVLHPSTIHYRRGCRCDECRKLQVARVKDYRERKKKGLI